jgi:membrane protein
MRQNIEKTILQSALYRNLKHRSDNTYLKDKKTSLSAILQILLRKIRKDELDARANAVAFNLTLSVFPAIIFLFTLIPYFPIPNLDKLIMDFLGQVLPYGIYEEASTTIHDIVSRPRANLLSLGFFLTLYVATNGMIALMDAFNRSYRTGEKRSFIKKRLIAVALTFIVAFVLFIAIILLITGNLVLKWLMEYKLLTDDLSYYSISFLQYFVVFFVFFVAISCIYYLAPAISKRWTFFSVGSIVAAILCITVTHLFSFYISNFASYNRLYGSIGTFIGLMIWFYLLSFILILGFEINASIDEARQAVLVVSVEKTPGTLHK